MKSISTYRSHSIFQKKKGRKKPTFFSFWTTFMNNKAHSRIRIKNLKKTNHLLVALTALVRSTKLSHNLIHHVTFILPIISESLDKSWHPCLVIYRQNNTECKDGSRNSPLSDQYCNSWRLVHELIQFYMATSLALNWNANVFGNVFWSLFCHFQHN